MDAESIINEIEDGVERDVEGFTCEECYVDGIAPEDHQPWCSQHPEFDGHCRECGHYMNASQEDDLNHETWCLSYPGNFECAQCGNVVNDEDRYMHAPDCEYNPSSWQCDYCNGWFAEDISEDDHYDDCEDYPHDDDDDDDDEIDEPTDALPDPEYYAPPAAYPLLTQEMKMGYKFRLGHVMTQEEVARLSTVPGHEGESLWCGNLKCAHCQQLTLQVKGHGELVRLLNPEEAKDEWVWGTSPYTTGQVAYLNYDREQPWSFIIAEIVEGDERFVNGVGLRVKGDVNQTWYDLMWVLPTESAGLRAMSVYAREPQHWTARGVAPAFIIAELARQQLSARSPINLNVFRIGDIVYQVRRDSVNTREVVDVNIGRATGEYVYLLKNIGSDIPDQVLTSGWWLCPDFVTAAEQLKIMQGLSEKERPRYFPFKNDTRTILEIRKDHLLRASIERFRRLLEKGREHLEKVGGGKEWSPQEHTTFPLGIDIDGLIELTDKTYPKWMQDIMRRHDPTAPVKLGQPVIVPYETVNRDEPGPALDYQYGTRPDRAPNPTVVLGAWRNDGFEHGWQVRLLGHNRSYDLMWLFTLQGEPVAPGIIAMGRHHSYDHITAPYREALDNFKMRAYNDYARSFAHLYDVNDCYLPDGLQLRDQVEMLCDAYDEIMEFVPPKKAHAVAGDFGGDPRNF